MREFSNSAIIVPYTLNRLRGAVDRYWLIIEELAVIKHRPMAASKCMMVVKR